VSQLTWLTIAVLIVTFPSFSLIYELSETMLIITAKFRSSSIVVLIGMLDIRHVGS